MAINTVIAIKLNGTEFTKAELTAVGGPEKMKHFRVQRDTDPNRADCYEVLAYDIADKDEHELLVAAWVNQEVIYSYAGEIPSTGIMGKAKDWLNL
jgi:hypothetical protein